MIRVIALPHHVVSNETERLIGDSAKNQAAVNAVNTIFDAKRLIGRKFSDPTVQSDLRHLPYKVTSDDTGKCKIHAEFKGETKHFIPKKSHQWFLLK